MVREEEDRKSRRTFCHCFHTADYCLAAVRLNKCLMNQWWGDEETSVVSTVPRVWWGEEAWLGPNVLSPHIPVQIGLGKPWIIFSWLSWDLSQRLFPLPKPLITKCTNLHSNDNKACLPLICKKSRGTMWWVGPEWELMDQLWVRLDSWASSWMNICFW